MPVQTHNSSRQALILKFRESDILYRPNENLAGFLFGEVITTQRYRKKILVSWVPADGSNMFFFLLIVKPPNRQQITFQLVLLFSFFPIVFIVAILAILFILPNHSLHNFHAS